jgi:nucleoside-triphosphatase
VDEGTPRLLLEGRPGIGKTTVARRLLQLLQEAGVPVAGFTTGELRTSGRREGFVVEAASGAQEVLAHVDLPGPPRVGRYGVDLAAFERVALPALHTPASGVVVVDELGKMELASTAFRAAVLELLGRAVAMVAVQVRHHRFTDALKRRPDIRVVRVTEGTRDALPQRLMERLVGGTPPREGAVTGASAPGLEAAARAKRAVRERVWARLERERAARVVKSNPDAPQLPVRARVLADGKLLYMAVPRLTDERPSSSSTRRGWRSRPAAPPPPTWSSRCWSRPA